MNPWFIHLLGTPGTGHLFSETDVKKSGMNGQLLCQMITLSVKLPIVGIANGCSNSHKRFVMELIQHTKDDTL